jgi:hypothetical protein
MKNHKIDKIINYFHLIKEEGMVVTPTNSLAGGKIAGTAEAGDHPPVRRGRKNIYMGLGSRAKWLKHLRTKER